ncbi:MAG TPA: phosphate ABC transporter substrate-binding protein [Anaerolineae bacterium]|nr:phosphate ABC transporter substrate-binding protein [Anaerolineae bacterium]
MRWFKHLPWLLWLTLLTACASNAIALPPTPTPLLGRITFAGSTTVQPLADKLGAAFQAQHPPLQLGIAAGGSVVGIKAMHDGTADIGMASRALTADEANGLQQYQIASDVIAIVVNPSNSITGLTRDQLRDIYLGQLVNWKDLGGPDRMIVPIARDKNSGTRGAFDELVLSNQEPHSDRLQTAVTAGDMAALVSSTPGAIGYVGFGNLDGKLKLLSIDSVTPSPDTVRNKTYQLVRPLLLLTGPLTQPLAQTYIDFALSPEGQALVEADGWVKVK